jgi:hypothetical protein
VTEIVDNWWAFLPTVGAQSIAHVHQNLVNCCFKRSFGFLQTKAYKSKTKINFSNFLTFLKEKHPCNSKCAFFSKTETRFIFCLSGTSLGAKSGLSDEFSQKMFPIITSPGNGNVCLGPRDLSEFGFKVDENSPPPKKIAGEISTKNKNNFFGT